MGEQSATPQQATHVQQMRAAKLAAAIGNAAVGDDEFRQFVVHTPIGRAVVARACHLRELAGHPVIDASFAQHPAGPVRDDSRFAELLQNLPEQARILISRAVLDAEFEQVFKLSVEVLRSTGFGQGLAQTLAEAFCFTAFNAGWGKAMFGFGEPEAIFVFLDPSRRKPVSFLRERAAYEELRTIYRRRKIPGWGQGRVDPDLLELHAELVWRTQILKSWSVRAIAGLMWEDKSKEESRDHIRKALKNQRRLLAHLDE